MSVLDAQFPVTAQRLRYDRPVPVILTLAPVQDYAIDVRIYELDHERLERCCTRIELLTTDCDVNR
ncbi:hypothetical protein [Candidatus Poriferisodalis sp.]|uniref:hypothetical protein n=1 Tax=Candidatus Poriferisodalis sp. TaxID=3101277 RepID=UPI003C7044D8